MSNEVPLPRVWREAVIAALRSNDDLRVRPTQTTITDWLVTFPDSWPFRLYEVLSEVLEDDQLTGRQVLTMRESGETWEFLFVHRSRKLYGKINLRPGELAVIVYPIHVRRKGDSL